MEVDIGISGVGNLTFLRCVHLLIYQRSSTLRDSPAVYSLLPTYAQSSRSTINMVNHQKGFKSPNFPPNAMWQGTFVKNKKNILCSSCLLFFLFHHSYPGSPPDLPTSLLGKEAQKVVLVMMINITTVPTTPPISSSKNPVTDLENPHSTSAASAADPIALRCRIQSPRPCRGFSRFDRGGCVRMQRRCPWLGRRWGRRLCEVVCALDSGIDGDGDGS